MANNRHVVAGDTIDGDDDDDETSGNQHAVFVDTSLDTHLVLVVSSADTVLHLKQKLVSEHRKCFGEIGDIDIHALKVKRKGYYYHLPDSMLVHSGFVGVKANWFLFAEASSKVGNCRPSSSGKNVCSDGPSNKEAVVVHGSSPQLANGLGLQQHVHDDPNQHDGLDLESSRMKDHHDNEDNGKSCLSDATEKSRDDEMQERLLPLKEKSGALGERKEGNNLSFPTDMEPVVQPEEQLDAALGGKKKRKRKKQVVSEHAPTQNDDADLPIKDTTFDGADPALGELEEHEVAPQNGPGEGDANLGSLHQQEMEVEQNVEDQYRNNDTDSRKGAVKKKGVKKRSYEAASNNAPEVRGHLIVSALKDTAPDGQVQALGSLEEHEIAPQNWPGEGDADLEISHQQEMESVRNVEDEHRSNDADSRKGAMKKKGVKKRSNEAASNNVSEAHHTPIVSALRATTELENGLSSENKSKKKRKGKAYDSTDEAIPHVPSAKAGEREISGSTLENGEEEAPDVMKNVLEEQNEVLNGFEGTNPSVADVSNIENEIYHAGPEPESREKKTKKRKKYVNDATAGSHQSMLTQDDEAFASPEVEDIVHDGFGDDNETSSHDVARTLLQMSGNNGAEMMVSEHEQLTSDGNTMDGEGDVPVPAAGKKRKSKKVRKSMAENQEVSALETFSNLATELPVDWSDKDILGTEAGNISSLHDITENVEATLQVHAELVDNAENNGEKKKKKSKKKKTLAASVLSDGLDKTADDMPLEGATQAVHLLEQPKANADCGGGYKEISKGKQNVTASIYCPVNGEADDSRPNTEEKSGNVSKKKRTMKQQSAITGTAADVISGKADEMSHNEIEPQPTAPVEKPEENVGKEVEKPKKQTRRKLKLSAGDSSQSLLEEKEKGKGDAYVDERAGDVGTYKTTTKTKSIEESFRDEAMGSKFVADNDVMDHEPSHPQRIDAIIASPSYARGSPTLRRQISTPNKKEGSRGESSELNINGILDEYQQEDPADEVPKGLGEKAKSDKKSVDNGVMKKVVENLSTHTLSDSQSFSKRTKSAVSERAMADQKGEPVPHSSPKNSRDSLGGIGSQPPRADPIDITPKGKKQSKGKSSKHTNSGDEYEESGAPVAKGRDPDKKVQPRNAKIDQYRVSYRKPSDNGITESLSASEGMKTVLGKSASLFQDASSASTGDEGIAAASASSTRSPDDKLYSSDDSEVSSKADGKVKKSAPSKSGGGFAAMLRRSARFKAAQLNASQSQPEDMSQDAEFVPESELNF